MAETDAYQPVDKNGSAVQVLTILSTEKIATTASSTAVSKETIVRVVSDADCNIAIGSSPTATTSDALLPRGIVEYFKLELGQRINVLGANLYVSTMN